MQVAGVKYSLLLKSNKKYVHRWTYLCYNCLQYNQLCKCKYGRLLHHCNFRHYMGWDYNSQELQSRVGRV